tara:strand:+ start:324 stop:500 length:177 start_codon:yes stop_codon:yes gene_type:complete
MTKIVIRKSEIGLYYLSISGFTFDKVNGDYAQHFIDSHSHVKPTTDESGTKTWRFNNP